MTQMNAKRKFAAPKAIDVSNRPMVKTEELFSTSRLPLLVTPELPDIDLVEWLKSNLAFVEEKLLDYGGVLFRGFAIRSQEDFQRFVEAGCKAPMNYKEGATPRTKLSDKVYTSTEFPPDQHIALHNELSYVTTWPQKIWFSCMVAPEVGGETPIADVRRVYAEIDPTVRETFEEKGWMLVRNYGTGFGLPWQDVFHTDDKEGVVEYCHSHEMTCEWLDDDHLRTKQVRPAVTKHPDTGEMLWFNHIAFWHESSLDPQVRELMIGDFGNEGLPYNTFYGDGTPISYEVAVELRRAYDTHTIKFPWEKGDILVLDNMLVAHGRSPYQGSRKVVVAMGEPITRTNL
ncbi:MAG: TauD/TfdA family dioxygenase [Tumebacillaceae bacterium]